MPFEGKYFDRGVPPSYEIFGDEGCFYGKNNHEPYITHFERQLGCRVYGNVGVAVAGYGEVTRMWREMDSGRLVERYERERVWVTSEERVTEVYRFIRE